MSAELRDRIYTTSRDMTTPMALPLADSGSRTRSRRALNSVGFCQYPLDLRQ
jgi:hypothetical protein